MGSLASFERVCGPVGIYIGTSVALTSVAEEHNVSTEQSRQIFMASLIAAWALSVGDYLGQANPLMWKDEQDLQQWSVHSQYADELEIKKADGHAMALFADSVLKLKVLTMIGGLQKSEDKKVEAVYLISVDSKARNGGEFKDHPRELCIKEHHKELTAAGVQTGKWVLLKGGRCKLSGTISESIKKR